MVRDVAVLVIATACWAGFFYKLRHLRERASGPGGPVLRSLVVLLGTLAWSIMLGAPAVSQFVDPAVGLPGFTRLVANVVSMCTCLVLREWLLHLSRPDDAATRIAIHRRRIVPVIVLVLVLYAFDHPPVTAEREFAGAYTYVFLLYVLATAGPVAIMYWIYARKVDAPMMRLGLRVACVGTCMGLTGITAVLVSMLEADSGLELPGTQTFAKVLYSTGSTLFVLGIILPAIGPRIGLEALWWRVARWRAARRLRLLWHAVTDACPGVVLDRALLAVSPYGSRLLVERLPVEIYDGWLELRHYLAPADVELVDRMSGRWGGRQRSARVAAAYVALAIERKAKGDPPVPAAPVVEYFGSRSGSSTLLADVRFLCDVSSQLSSRALREALAASRVTSGANEVQAT